MQGARGWATARRLGRAAALGLALAVGAGGLSEVAAVGRGQARLAADLETPIVLQLKGGKLVPANDQARTAKCLAQAIVADIPDADAARLSDMLNDRAKLDQALERKWMAISEKDAPARYNQVMAYVQKTCPDLGPYVRGML